MDNTNSEAGLAPGRPSPPDQARETITPDLSFTRRDRKFTVREASVICTQCLSRTVVAGVASLVGLEDPRSGQLVVRHGAGRAKTGVMNVGSSSRSPLRGRRVGPCAVAIVAVTLIGGSAYAAGATVPGAPAITSVVGAVHAVAVAFTKPADDGGESIGGYHAVCTSPNGGVTGSHGGTHSPIDVPGLSADKTYTCTVTAKNHIGVGPASRPSARVVVLPTAPGKPTIRSVTAGIRAVAVNFTGPVRDGGAPISYYRAVCSSHSGGATRMHQGTTSPISVRGLAAADTYRCTVAAGNRSGLGDPSAPSSPVIVRPTAPGAPTIVSAKAGIQSVTVAFTTPTSTGGSPITNYLVVCASKNGGPSGTRGASHSPIRVDNLAATKTYTCTVSAANVVRRGPASLPSKPVEPRSD